MTWVVDDDWFGFVADCGEYTGPALIQSPGFRLPADCEGIEYLIGQPGDYPDVDDAAGRARFAEGGSEIGPAWERPLVPGDHLWVVWYPLGYEDPNTADPPSVADPLTLVTAGYVAGASGPALASGARPGPWTAGEPGAVTQSAVFQTQSTSDTGAQEPGDKDLTGEAAIAQDGAAGGANYDFTTTHAGRCGMQVDALRFDDPDFADIVTVEILQHVFRVEFDATFFTGARPDAVKSLDEGIDYVAWEWASDEYQNVTFPATLDWEDQVVGGQSEAGTIGPPPPFVTEYTVGFRVGQVTGAPSGFQPYGVGDTLTTFSMPIAVTPGVEPFSMSIPHNPVQSAPRMWEWTIFIQPDVLAGSDEAVPLTPGNLTPSTREEWVYFQGLTGPPHDELEPTILEYEVTYQQPQWRLLLPGWIGWGQPV